MISAERLSRVKLEGRLTKILQAMKAGPAADLENLLGYKATFPLDMAHHEKIYPARLQRLEKSLDSVHDEEAQFHPKITSFAHQGDIIENYNKEPDRAVCDSIGYIRIPSVFTTLACSTAFNLISTSRSPPQSDATAYPNAMPLCDGQMARDYDFKNPADIFATAQNLVAPVQAFLEDPSEQKVELDGVEPEDMHNLLHAVQTGGAEPDSSLALDMQKGMIFLVYSRMSC